MTAPLASSISTTGAPPSASNTSGAGAPGAPPTGSVNDLFDQLKEFVWKGVSVPVTETEFEIRHDLVIHKFADRNGAYVENTGRHPVQITARIPFLNTIYSAASESWAQGNLYPYQFRFFITKCLETTSGTLQHPEFGPLNCKLDLTRTTWSGVVRGGVWVHATWIESDDTEFDLLDQDLSRSSPVAQLVSSADGIDEQIATLQSAVSAQQNPLPPLQFSFSDLAAAISGVVDPITLLQKEVQGRVDNVIYQCNRVETSLSLAANASPLNWPIFQNCERLKSSAFQLKAQAAIAVSGTSSIVTQKDSTIGQIALAVGSDVSSIITLNPGLVAKPVVPAGTTVLFYQSAA